MGGGWSLFWYALCCVLSSFSIILTSWRELVALLLLFFLCIGVVNVMWLLLTVPWVYWRVSKRFRTIVCTLSALLTASQLSLLYLVVSYFVIIVLGLSGKKLLQMFKA